jgi:hypothetical protein
MYRGACPPKPWRRQVCGHVTAKCAGATAYLSKTPTQSGPAVPFAHRVAHNDVEQSYRGVASGRPPSTGIVAPVVGVCREAKKNTALATCRPVTRAFSRLRLW